MKINYLNMSAFGKFDQKEINLSNNLNIILGENESGKSTIFHFIKAMFFGLKGGRISKTEYLSSSKRFRPWNGNMYKGTIMYTLDDMSSIGQEFIIERDFNSDEFKIYNESYKDVSNSFMYTSEKGCWILEKQLGINEKCFEKTALIRQDGVIIDDVSGKDILGRISNVYSSGNEDISIDNVVKILKETRKNQIGTDKTSTKPIDLINQEIERMKNKVILIEQERNKYHDIETRIKEWNSEKDTYFSYKIFLQKYRRIFDLQENIDSMTEKVEKSEVILKNYLVKNKELKEKINSKEKAKLTKENEFRGIANLKTNEIEKLKNYKNEKNQLLESINALKGKEISIDNEISEEKKNGKIENFEKLNKLDNELENIFDSVLKNIADNENKILDLEDSVKNIDSSIFKVEKTRKTKKMVLGVCVFFVIFFSSAAYFTIEEPINWIFEVVTAVVFFSFSLFIISTLFDDAEKIRKLEKSKNEKTIDITKCDNDLKNDRDLLEKTYNDFGVLDLDGYKNLVSIYFIKKEMIKEKNYEKDIIKYNIKAKELENLQLENEILEILAPINCLNYSENIKKTDMVENGIIVFLKNYEEYRNVGPMLALFDIEINKISEEVNKIVLDLKLLINSDINDIEIETNTFIENTKSTLEQYKIELAELENLISTRFSSLLDTDGKYNILDVFVQDNYIEKAKDFIENELNEIDKIEEDLKIQINKNTGKLEELFVSESNIQEILEKIESLEIKKMKMIETSEALMTAENILLKCSEELKLEFSPNLNNKMSAYFYDISNGKYSDIKVDDSFNISVKDEKTKLIKKASDLSIGTIEQIYFSMRVAIADIIGLKGEKLPLILDETFVFYDDKRLRQAIKFLKKLSESTQVIYLTCKETDAELFKNICKDCMITMI